MKGHSLPARCTKCDKVFQPQLGGIFVGGTIAEVSGNRISCPYCGGIALVGDGEYDTRGDKLVLNHGPAITREMMAQLEALKASVEAGEITREEAIAEADKIKPGLGDWFKINWMGLAGLVLGVTSLANDLATTSPSSTQVERLINVQEHSNELLARQIAVQEHQGHDLLDPIGKPDARAHAPNKGRRARYWPRDKPPGKIR